MYCSHLTTDFGHFPVQGFAQSQAQQGLGSAAWLDPGACGRAMLMLVKTTPTHPSSRGNIEA